MNFKAIVAKQALVENVRNHWFYMGISILGILSIKYAFPDEAMEDPTLSIVFLMFNILAGVLLISAGARYIAPFVSKKAFVKGAEKINAKYIFYLTLWREFIPNIDAVEEKVVQEIKLMKSWIAEAERGDMRAQVHAKIAKDSEKEIEYNLWKATLAMLQIHMLESEEAQSRAEELRSEYFHHFYESQDDKELKTFVLGFYFKVKSWQDKLQRQMA